MADWTNSLALKNSREPGVAPPTGLPKLANGPPLLGQGRIIRGFLVWIWPFLTCKILLSSGMSSSFLDLCTAVIYDGPLWIFSKEFIGSTLPTPAWISLGGMEYKEQLGLTSETLPSLTIMFNAICYYGKVWKQEEKGMKEDKMVGQCHRSDQHEFDPTPRGSGRQESLAWSGPWGHEESDTTEQQQISQIAKNGYELF